MLNNEQGLEGLISRLLAETHYGNHALVSASDVALLQAQTTSREVVLEEAAEKVEQRLALVRELAPEAANAVLEALPSAIRALASPSSPSSPSSPQVEAANG